MICALSEVAMTRAVHHCFDLKLLLPSVLDEIEVMITSPASSQSG